MGTYILKRRTFSIYDDTDNLKRMKDSDILSEKKRTNPGYGGVVASGLAAGVTGAGIGAVALGGKGLFKKGRRLSSFGKGLKKGGKWGAIIGATAGTVGALKKRSDVVQDNKFYNSRLEFAQNQAKRREGKDWKTNMTQRDGYSF